MRSYPRRVFKSEKETILVFCEAQEIKASSEGYESSYKKEIIDKYKGTDREILRGESVDITPPPVFEKELTRGQKAALTRKKNRKLKNGNG